MKRKRPRELRQRIRSTEKRIRRLGAAMAIDPRSPDWIVRAFLDEIDDCPLCRKLEQNRAPLAPREH